jgi:type IV pilus assembly protein PilZ
MDKPRDPQQSRPPAASRPPAPKVTGDKRAAGRAQITLKVDYKRLNSFFADYTKNISKGGTFIGTAKPLEVGTEFRFVLSLPSDREPLTLNGEVVWVVTEAEATAEKPCGMGIKFRFTRDGEREKVELFVENLMKEALGEHISKKLLAKTPV